MSEGLGVLGVSHQIPGGGQESREQGGGIDWSNSEGGRKDIGGIDWSNSEGGRKDIKKRLQQALACQQMMLIHWGMKVNLPGCLVANIAHTWFKMGTSPPPQFSALHTC